MKQGTAKIFCSCEHAQQDKMYGKHVRIANTTAKQDGSTAEVRCTVCGTVQRVPLTKVK